MQTQSAESSLPPHAVLIQIGTAYWGSQMLLAAAKLKLADVIGDRPRSADDLATELGLNAGATYRFLRTLAGMGVLTEVESRTFALTPLGQALKRDAPGSAYATILTLTGDLVQQAWAEMLYSLSETSVRTRYMTRTVAFPHKWL